jgi:hypothetical protein
MEGSEVPVLGLGVVDLTAAFVEVAQAVEGLEGCLPDYNTPVLPYVSLTVRVGLLLLLLFNTVR